MSRTIRAYVCVCVCVCLCVRVCVIVCCLLLRCSTWMGCTSHQIFLSGGRRAWKRPVEAALTLCCATATARIGHTTRALACLWGMETSFAVFGNDSKLWRRVCLSNLIVFKHLCKFNSQIHKLREFIYFPGFSNQLFTRFLVLNSSPLDFCCAV